MATNALNWFSLRKVLTNFYLEQLFLSDTHNKFLSGAALLI
jgi:hypothetical protein